MSPVSFVSFSLSCEPSPFPVVESLEGLVSSSGFCLSPFSSGLTCSGFGVIPFGESEASSFDSSVNSVSLDGAFLEANLFAPVFLKSIESIVISSCVSIVRLELFTNSSRVCKSFSLISKPIPCVGFLPTIPSDDFNFTPNKIDALSLYNLNPSTCTSLLPLATKISPEGMRKSFNLLFSEMYFSQL